jgi:hypothetical protein
MLYCWKSWAFGSLEELRIELKLTSTETVESKGKNM